MLKKWLLFAFVIILMTGLFGCGNPQPAVSHTTASQSGWTLFASGAQINMLITKGDDIWAATASGVERWNRKTGSCKLYTVQEGLPDGFFGVSRWIMPALSGRSVISMHIFLTAQAGQFLTRKMRLYPV